MTELLKLDGNLFGVEFHGCCGITKIVWCSVERALTNRISPMKFSSTPGRGSRILMLCSLILLSDGVLTLELLLGDNW